MKSRLAFVPLLALLLVFLGGILTSGKSRIIFSRTFIIQYVIDPQQVDYVVKLFKDRLHHQDPNAAIIGCNEVTRVAPGGTGNFGVGAACAVRSGNRMLSALMCQNSPSGRLICAQSRAPTRDEVIRFIEANCLPSASR